MLLVDARSERRSSLRNGRKVVGAAEWILLFRPVLPCGQSNGAQTPPGNGRKKAVAAFANRFQQRRRSWIAQNGQGFQRRSAHEKIRIALGNLHQVRYRQRNPVFTNQPADPYPRFRKRMSKSSNQFLLVRAGIRIQILSATWAHIECVVDLRPAMSAKGNHRMDLNSGNKCRDTARMPIIPLIPNLGTAPYSQQSEVETIGREFVRECAVTRRLNRRLCRST